MINNKEIRWDIAIDGETWTISLDIEEDRIWPYAERDDGVTLDSGEITNSSWPWFIVLNFDTNRIELTGEAGDYIFPAFGVWDFRDRLTAHTEAIVKKCVREIVDAD